MWTGLHKPHLAGVSDLVAFKIDFKAVRHIQYLNETNWSLSFHAVDCGDM